MTLEEAMQEIFYHGFVFTLRPKKALEALKVIRKTLLDYIELDEKLRTVNEENGELKRMLRAWNTRAPSWISCSERMPEKDGDYLCISNNEYKILPYRNGEFYCVCFDSVNPEGYAKLLERFPEFGALT